MFLEFRTIITSFSRDVHVEVMNVEDLLLQRIITMVVERIVKETIAIAALIMGLFAHLLCSSFSICIKLQDWWCKLIIRNLIVFNWPNR